MPRKQPKQPSEVASEVTPQEAPKADITDVPKASASPVTKASPKFPRKVELPGGRIIETF